ncbi:MAG: C-terminal binding protein [Syntrophomonadaceae bacterium]|nr:C-terminal binding protein [Syntrophomonadaceae bacterium]
MTPKYKVVVTDYEYQSLHWEEKEVSSVGGILVPCQLKTEQELIDECKDADALLVQYAKITRKVIENLEKCKVIVRYGVGVDSLDIEAATEHGIYVANVPDYGLEDVADHAMALLLAAARKVLYLHHKVVNDEWDYKLAKPLYRLRGKTLGLMAFGNIAKMVANKAKAFGINVLVYDPYLSEKIANEYEVSLVDFDTLIKTSDFISIHAPVTPETYQIFNQSVFKQMKPSCIIVNTARGALINENDLVEALEKGYIAGAALDVTDPEPISKDSKLKTMENVIITPHAAWYTEEAQDSLQRQAAQEVARVLSGEKPLNLVNKLVQPK